MGTRDGGLACVVDEIPDFHPPVPPATTQPFLVLLGLEDRISVRLVVPTELDQAETITRSAIFTGTPDDERSDDEDEEVDTKKQ